jgi:hypothetical protein
VRSLEVREPLAAWLLTTMAIAGWSTTFDGWVWFVVGAVGAALGSVVAAVHARRHTMIWSLVTVPLAYLLLGVVVLGVDFGGNGLPRASTLSDVVSGAWECWPLLVGTHPPVEATGTVLLAPASAGVLVAAVTTALAVESKRPAWPVVPLLLLLTWVLVTGSRVSASVALFGGAYGLACLVWVILRASRAAADGSPVAARWPLAAPILVVCTLLAVPLGTAFLGDDDSRLVLREQAAAYGVTVVTTPLDSFRRYRKQPGDLPDNAWRRRLLLATGAPPGTVLRFAVLNRYDGRSWVAANDVEQGSHDDRFQLFSADYLTTDEATGRTPIRINLTGSWNSQWLPLAGRLVGLNTDFPGSIPLDVLRFNPVTSSAIATRTLGGDDEYEFFFDAVDTTLPDHARPSSELDSETYDAADFLDNWAKAVRHKSDSRMDAVRRGAALMRQRGRYSDGAFGWEVQFARGQDRLRLDDFMNGPRMVGDDEQYAAAMALLATRLHVPARVVVGARVPPDGVVKGNDVVAWVELRIADGSWRELPRSSYMSFRPPRKSDPPNDPVVAEPQPSPPPQPQPRPSPSVSPQPNPDQDRPHEAKSSPPKISRWLLLLLVPAAIGALPGYKAWRRLRRRRAPRISLRYAGGWQEIVDQARDLGIAVPSRRSRPTQAGALGTGSDLARVADDAVFGAAEPSPVAAESFWTAALDVRRHVGAGLPLWRRWLAPFSLASLRRS